MNLYIDSMTLYLNEGLRRNFVCWAILGAKVFTNPQPIPMTYQAEIDRLKQWIGNRINWLDANMPGNCFPVSVPENNSQEGISIFPNPSSGMFTIDSKVDYGEISIYNVLGERVFEILNIKPHTPDQIDLSDQPSGIYFYEVKNVQRIMKTGKLIIQ